MTDFDLMIVNEDEDGAPDVLELRAAAGPITFGQAEALLRVCWTRETRMASGDDVVVSVEDLVAELAAEAPDAGGDTLFRMARRCMAWSNAVLDDEEVGGFDARMIDDYSLIPAAAAAIAAAPLLDPAIAGEAVYERFDLDALRALLGCGRTVH